MSESGNSWKNDKNKSALYANNILLAIEVCGIMELNIWLQTHTIGVMAKGKENPLVWKMRDRSYEFSHVPW